jgi:hypothetical protein
MALQLDPGAVAFRSDHENRQCILTRESDPLNGCLIVECDVKQAVDPQGLAESYPQAPEYWRSGALGV